MAGAKEVNKDDLESSVRAQSKVAYPYYNLDASIEVAQAVHEKGGGDCSPAHLASFLGYSTTRSGTFLTRLSSARLFGFVSGGGDSLRVTDRAIAIISPVMPEDAVKAKVDAFLDVPLYNDIYGRFKDTSLPPEVGLKNLLKNTYKIVDNRISPALRVFYESAQQAGFFDLSPERTKLIPPLMKKGKSGEQTEKPDPKGGEDKPPVYERPRGGGGDGPSGIHPALAGLLRELPPPGPWEKTKKEEFLSAFTGLFNFIYPAKDSE